MKKRQEIEAEYDRLREFALTDEAAGRELEIVIAMRTLKWILAFSEDRPPLDFILCPLPPLPSATTLPSRHQLHSGS